MNNSKVLIDNLQIPLGTYQTLAQSMTQLNISAEQVRASALSRPANRTQADRDEQRKRVLQFRQSILAAIESVEKFEGAMIGNLSLPQPKKK